jgi:hypothetical protein
VCVFTVCVRLYTQNAFFLIISHNIAIALKDTLYTYSLSGRIEKGIVVAADDITVTAFTADVSI